MDGYYKLIRRIHSKDSIQPTGYLPWTECLSKYNVSINKKNYVYSKTEGIHSLLCAVKENRQDTGFLDQANIFLTDRGLLFPQTRERFYDSPDRSMKRHILACSAGHTGADYHPALANEQESAFLEQVEAFHQSTLSEWRIALPALKQYLYPDLTRFQHRFAERSGTEGRWTRYINRLTCAFRRYLDQMEFFVSPNVNANDIAYYFICKSFLKSKQPVYLDRPDIIFQIFRSPVHRCLYQGGWAVADAIWDGCVCRPLPITVQSLSADRELFQEIISICFEACAKCSLSFSREPWDALWMCIEACVQCLPYQVTDLFSVQYMFRQLLKFRRSGYPILDRWLEQKLYTESNPIYIAHWRALVKKLHIISKHQSKDTDLWLDSICAYRKLLESPQTDDSDIFPVIEPLAAKVPRNQIPTIPDQTELERIIAKLNQSADETSRIPPLKKRSRRGPLAAMQGARMSTYYKTTDAARAIDAVHTEWLLLQCVCGQAQRELMETIYLLLTKTDMAREPNRNTLSG